MTQPITDSVLLLRPQDIADVVTVGDAIDWVEQGYREASLNRAINQPRRRVEAKATRLVSFLGGADGLGAIGVLTRTETPARDPQTGQTYRGHPVTLLWDSTASRLLSIIIGEPIDKRVGPSSAVALRTGATSGVAFRHLARRNARSAGVIGTGGQALHKVLALHHERPIASYKVFSRKAENRAALCEKLRKLVDAEFVPVESAKDAISGVDVVICATNSGTPVFDGHWLEPGQHLVTVVGASAPARDGKPPVGRREADDVAVKRADLIATNWRESVELERPAGLIEPLEKGIITWADVREIGEIAAGTVPGRTSDSQITYHANSSGTAAADLAIARGIYDRCRELGRGITLDLPRAGR
jgi:alanine dehydrogenase